MTVLGGAERRSRMALGVLAVLAAWALASAFASPAALPSPLRVARTLVEETGGGGLPASVAASLARALAGFALGAAGGVVVGGLMGVSRPIGAALRPLLEVARPVPPLAWIPLAILWFGIDDASKVFVVALGAFFPVLVSTYFGIRRLDPAYVRAARSLGARRSAVFARVIVPAALPDIFTGLRMGWALGFISLIAAELVSARSGLGYLLTTGRLNDRLDLILASVVVIGALGLMAEWLLRAAGQRLLRWMPTMDGATETNA